jgi:hypothetical protein
MRLRSCTGIRSARRGKTGLLPLQEVDPSQLRLEQGVPLSLRPEEAMLAEAGFPGISFVLCRSELPGLDLLRRVSPNERCDNWVLRG